MTLRTKTGHQRAETIDDLVQWVRALEGGPAVSRVILARCERPAHGTEPATWFYVEADARAGVARTRCLSCGDARPLLDSADHWTYPPAWSCSNCNQSIAEVVYGVHETDGTASWLVMAVRCVECGTIQGMTDVVVPDVDADMLCAAL